MTDQPTEPDPQEQPRQPPQGPPKDQPQQQPQADAAPGGVGAWLFGALIGAVVVGLIVAAWVAGKDEGRRQAERSGPAQATSGTPASTPSAAAGPGKQLFVAKCGTCHTLKAAGTTGAIGPNLDDLKPDVALVLEAEQKGGAGSGGMPPRLYQGAQAQQVADYVAAATGGG